MSIWLRLSLAAVFIVSAFIAVSAYTRGGEITALVNSQSCYEDLFYETPEDVTAVLIGSSRTRRGLLPNEIGAQLGFEPGQMVNLGHPGYSPAYDYNLLERVSSQRELELVVFEIQPKSAGLLAREAQIYDVFEADIHLLSGDYSYVFANGVSLGAQYQRVRSGTGNTLAALWDMTHLQIQRLSRALFLIPLGYLGSGDKPVVDGEVGCLWQEWLSPEENIQLGNAKEARLREAYEDAFDMDVPSPETSHMGFFDEPQSALSRSIIQDTVALSKERGFELVFYYLPSIDLPTDRAAITARFSEDFGAPLLIPDRATRVRLNATGYVDQHHLNNSGRATLSEWMIQQLRIHASGI